MRACRTLLKVHEVYETFSFGACPNPREFCAQQYNHDLKHSKVKGVANFTESSFTCPLGLNAQQMPVTDALSSLFKKKLRSPEERYLYHEQPS